MRRAVAVLAMLAIVALVLMLTWQVQLHRNHRIHDDEPAIVSIPARGAISPV